MYLPDSTHQALEEEPILLLVSWKRSAPRVPDLTIAPLHQPALEIYRMLDIWVRKRRSREPLESGVKFGNAVLSQKTKEVKPLEREFSWG